MEHQEIDTPKESEEMLQDIDIKNKNIKYPFSGIAPNLIDKFLVLAYEPKTIEHTYQCFNIDPKNEFKTRFRYFEFEERPYIVNEIVNDYAKDLLDNDLILELIFPNFPQMYFLEKQFMTGRKELDEELLISNYSIIFSINPQDNSGSKKSYNGLGFIFYVPTEHKTMGEVDGVLYVPMAYVILSEFPYFYHFNEICKNVLIQMKKESDEIPIDILLYNTVKYAPSPINMSINLSFGALFGFPQNKNNRIEDILISLNTNSGNANKGIPTLFFNQLSGYPFMDINLSFIFNLIPPEIIVEVFIFSFLEHDIIFYSSRPEILNMVMYIFSCFNYPFNDSIYYWHVLSVSEDSFMSGSSTFVGKTCSTITGILSEYDPDILTTKKIREHFVLDIDNKNFFFLYQEETEEVKDTMELYTYIKNCAADADEISGDTKKIDKETKIKHYFNDGIQLYEVIRNLMEELQRRAKKVTSTNYNEKLIKPTFLTLYEDESEMECIKSNMRLQKAFFTFITQIMQNFVSILSIGEENKERDSYSESRIPSIVININIKKEDNSNEEEEKKRRLMAKKAGKIFKAKFQDCSKYSSFVINFCKFHETIDLYKIPYTFINEFVYYSHVAVRNNLSEVDVFKLIDQFYGRRKMIDFDELINENELEKKKMEKNDEKRKEEERRKEEAKRREEEKKKEKNKKDKKNKNDKSKDNIINDSMDMINSDPNKNLDTDLQNIYLFTFDNFIEYYKDNLRAQINREQDDDREIFTKVKQTNKNFKKYKRNGFFLSNKILNYYTNFSNNNTNALIDVFKLIKCEYEKNIISEDVNIKENAAPTTRSSINDNSIILKKNISNNIDYYYILRERLKLKENEKLKGKEKEKEMEKKKAERDLKLFGAYEFMEITDVIERHFILERCFSSYGLIKFSLLNILAVTREIKGLKVKNKHAIRSMCDFCEKSKSLVRKYMNIFLNIFKTLKNRNVEDSDECLNIITLYFKKTNMIPTEETTKAFTEIKESETKRSISEHEQEAPLASAEEKEKNEEDEKIFKELVDQRGQFFELKEGIMQTNTTKKFEDVLKTIETVFSGIYKSGAVSFNYKEVSNLYQFINKSEKFLPMTPLSLYSSTNKILINYLQNYSIDPSMYKELGKYILSLLYYFKIPTIGLKWNDQYKHEEKVTLLRMLHKDKSGRKSKELEAKEGELKQKEEEIKSILKCIITILIDLFDVICPHKKR